MSYIKSKSCNKVSKDGKFPDFKINYDTAYLFSSNSIINVAVIVLIESLYQMIIFNKSMQYANNKFQSFENIVSAEKRLRILIKVYNNKRYIKEC